MSPAPHRAAGSAQSATQHRAAGSAQSATQHRAAASASRAAGRRAARRAAQLAGALATADPDGPLPAQLSQQLAALGADALAALLAVYARLDEGVQRGLVADAVAGLGCRDERVLGLLTSRLSFEPGLAAESLATYGDASALPALYAALRAEQLALEAAPPDPDAYDDALALLDAIGRLGGGADPEVVALWERLLDLRDAGGSA